MTTRVSLGGRVHWCQATSPAHKRGERRPPILESSSFQESFTITSLFLLRVSPSSQSGTVSGKSLTHTEPGQRPLLTFLCGLSGDGTALRSYQFCARAHTRTHAHAQAFGEWPASLRLQTDPFYSFLLFGANHGVPWSVGLDPSVNEAHPQTFMPCVCLWPICIESGIKKEVPNGAWCTVSARYGICYEVCGQWCSAATEDWEFQAMSLGLPHASLAHSQLSLL